MIRKSSDLPRHLDWQHLMWVLDQAPGATLPARLPCPLDRCGGELTCYVDTPTGSQWLHCNRCQFAGDSIEFAGRVWGGLSGLDTISKLKLCGVSLSELDDPNTVERYLRNYPDRRRRVWRVWQQSRHALLHHTNHRRNVQHWLGLPDSSTALEAAACLLGAGQADQIRKSLRLLNAKFQKLRWGTLPLRGGGWEDVLLCPLFDLPGRISSFLLLGRQGRIPEDTCFWPANHTRHPRDRNCGIALYGAAAYAEDTIFCMADPFTALRLQFQHLRSASQPAPLVSIYQEGSWETAPWVWSQFGSKRLCFWGPPSHLLIRHAKASGGLVSSFGFENGVLQLPRLAATAFGELSGQILAEAVPWDTALEAALVSLPPTAAESLLLGLRFDRRGLRAFLGGCAATVRERMSYLNSRPEYRTVMYAHRQIRETNDCWFRADNGEQISSFTIALTDIHYREPDRPTYSGEIRHAGRAVPFCSADMLNFNQRPLLAAQMLVERKLGVLAPFTARWESHALQIARLFSNPQITDGPLLCGYNAADRAFCFPSYRILIGGQISRHNRREVYGPCRPADLDEPIESGSWVWRQLCPVGWAIFRAVVDVLLCQAADKRSYGYVITGPHWESAVRIAQALGCVKLTGTNLHNWPVLASATNQTDLTDYRTIIVQPTYSRGYATAFAKGRHVIEVPDKLAVPGRQTSCLVPSLVGYLAQDAERLRHGRITDWCPEAAEIDAAACKLTVLGGMLHGLCHAVGAALSEGAVSWAPLGSTKKAPNLIYRRQDGVFIPEDVVEKLTRERLTGPDGGGWLIPDAGFARLTKKWLI
jgi:hypothetical protein